MGGMEIFEIELELVERDRSVVINHIGGKKSSGYIIVHKKLLKCRCMIAFQEGMLVIRCSDRRRNYIHRK